MTPHSKSPELSEGYLRASSWWTPIIWGMGISGFLGLVVIAVILLEQKHLIPKWVFAWISNDRITQKRQFVRMLCGLLALWFGARLLKIGFFGNTARTIYTGVLSKLKFSQGHPDEWTHEQICAVRNVRSALF